MRQRKERLLADGRIIIPRAIRTSKRLRAGDEFTVDLTPDGVLLKRKQASRNRPLRNFRRPQS